MVQRESKSLHSYIKRYTSACADVKNLNENFTIHAFSVGVSNKHVRYALLHKDITTMHEWVTRAQKFIEVDEIRDHHSI